MADPKARIEKQKAWTDSIQTSLLLKKLQNHILKEEFMTATQIQAAKLLLDRTIPVLKQIEHTGDLELTHKIRGWKKI
jgi:hypothetical protein